MKNKVIVLVVALVILAGGGFYSYKYFQGKAKNPLAGQTVKVEGYDINYGRDGESATITDPKTGSKMITGPNLKVPSDFPKEIPVYSNGVVTVISLDPKFPLISVSTKDDVKTVQDWYQADLQKKGWTLTANQMIGPDAAHIEFENTNNMGSLIITKDDESKGTIITLSAMTREEAQKMFKGVMGGDQKEETPDSEQKN